MQTRYILFPCLHYSTILAKSQFVNEQCCPYKVAAEQKARVTYDNILRLSDDPDVNDVIRFLRAREIVHFQRFGEGLRLAKDRLGEKNVYFMNPSFDK